MIIQWCLNFGSNGERCNKVTLNDGQPNGIVQQTNSEGQWTAVMEVWAWPSSIINDEWTIINNNLQLQSIQVMVHQWRIN